MWCDGTSIVAEARRRSPAMSASLAKSVSTSANLADLRDSSSRISSSFFFSSTGACNKIKSRVIMLLNIYICDYLYGSVTIGNFILLYILL